MSEPLFPTVAIVGVGLIGGSIGMALRQRGLAHRVVGVARRPETERLAVERGAVDEATRDLRAGVADADLVILCAPVLTIPVLAEQMAPALRPGAVVTDVGSTKEFLGREVARHLPAGCPFVGGHPMAGSERGGVEAARADLFEGATWVLCEPSAAGERASDGSDRAVGSVRSHAQEPRAESREPRAPAKLAQWIAALGARPIVMDAATHDRVVAAISHLPHVVAAALVNGVVAGGEGAEVLRTFIAGGFTSTTRIASSPPELWRDICLTNRPAVLATLARFREALVRFEDSLRAEDGEALLAAFADARGSREELIVPSETHR